MSPRPAMGAIRRPQILDATARVIARTGVTGLRLADVAEEAEVSVGTIQHYFGTRDALLMETFAFVSQQALERWLAESDGVDSWIGVVALVDIVIDPPTFRERWTRWLQFWAAYSRDPRLRPRMGATYEQWRLPFRRLFEAGIEAGEFQPTEPVDTIVDRTIALFDGLALQVLLEAPGASIERMRELLLESLAADLRIAQSTRNGERTAFAGATSPRPRLASSGT